MKADGDGHRRQKALAVLGVKFYIQKRVYDHRGGYNIKEQVIAGAGGLFGEKLCLIAEITHTHQDRQDQHLSKGGHHIAEKLLQQRSPRILVKDKSHYNNL